MLFNSFIFLALLAITFGIYYIPKIKKYQLAILIISSLAFYSYDKFAFVFLLLFSAAINIVSSYCIVYGNVKHKKTLALSGVVLNITVLAFFKYSGLISGLFLDPEGSIGNFMLHIPLPIGISFFTFEGISLVIDVWKEKYIDNKQIVPESFSRHAQRTLFFISFFPHLIAGPILKAHDFYPQIKEKYFKDIQWEAAFKALIIGYFLKMVVADNLKDFTFLIEYPFFEAGSTLTILSLVLGYSCQIFADFAGYSLIAIGLAKLFGYNFQENFNFPYISTSFKDFWKRWHISLSTFLMEYLYFPLGGNRKGKARTYFNLLLTMTLGGLWHGAAWSYALWGFAHGSALAIERLISENTNLKHNKVTLVLKGIFVFLFISFAWLLFKMPDINHVFAFFKTLVYNRNMNNSLALISYTLVYSSPVILYYMIYLTKGSRFWSLFKKTEYIFYATMLFLILVNSGTSGSFIYFQF